MTVVTKVRYWRMSSVPFWQNTRRNEQTGCIEWMAAKHPQGYGVARRIVGEPEERRAHRRAWEMLKGEIPKGMHVLHACDNPSCVNVEHLFLGTDLDNARDKIAKGRAVNLRGAKHGMSRLVEEDVRRIREAHLFGARPADLCRIYGVTDAAIHNAISRKSWAHLE